MIFRPKELNFRAWDKKNRVMIKNINKIDLDNKEYIFMQETGGVDNKNTPVYEGDFLLGNFYKDLIYAMYCNSCLSFRLHGKEEGCFGCMECNFDGNKPNYISVIGNVFDGITEHEASVIRKFRTSITKGDFLLLQSNYKSKCIKDLDQVSELDKEYLLNKYVFDNFN